MASHHCHHHHACCCCQQPHHSLSSPPPPPPSLSPSHSLSDPLLQSIASHLSHLLSPHPPQNPPLHQLHRRISALESALRHLSVNPSRPSPPPPPTHFFSLKERALSLKDAAARTIQTHFRAFLVRRSRTLRHLENLSTAKTHLKSLQLSLSNPSFLSLLRNRVLVRQDFAEKAMSLLIKVDSIQSGNVMIREGKKSITRELIHLIELIDSNSNHKGANKKWPHVKSKYLKFRVSDDHSQTSLEELKKEVAHLDLGFAVSINDVKSKDLTFGVSNNHSETSLEELKKEVAELDLGFRVSMNDRRTHFDEISSGLEGMISRAWEDDQQMISRVRENVHDPVEMQQNEIISRVCGNGHFPMEMTQDEMISRVLECDEGTHLDSGVYGKTYGKQGEIGLCAPKPLHMEPRISDLMKDVTKRVV
ncbi:hypothetical protein AMTRI_Chr10g440 [Amborella trichopoda]